MSAWPMAAPCGVCLQRIDDDPDLDGGTIVVRHLSAEAVRLLYRLLSEGELLMLPMAVATSAAAAKTVDAPWPVIQVIASAAHLRGILRRGAHDWWLHRRGEQRT